ncbi:5-histidylcysteine sulfoxide synthase [Thalassotalea atypica]|uniref:5-histidylcysteine sulfoxide synthase n=1 Tax=Thalassotalea atypica TaxID=2054316 RepID=UPI00257352F3|nr:5-histidylcysteine sulfoxide synthase [Thalassotalea atypica]
MNTPALTGKSVEEKKTELKLYLLNSWSSYESLFGLINNDDAFYQRPEPLRHPLIFYYGHTATFFVNKLLLGKYIDQRINERLEAICAVGVDEMSWDDLDATHYDWPSVSEVRHYRNQVIQLVCKLIDNMDLTLPISQDSLAWVILMGIEHERIHLETSSVIMRMLPLEHLSSSEHWPTCPDSGEGPVNKLNNVSGRTVTLGKSSDDRTFGWDNEYGHAQVDVPDFKASQYLVSNQEYLGFIEAGGYQSPQYWTEEGQQWLSYRQASMPRFWYKKNNQYYQRNLLELVPLPLNWPVEVNYLEAKAFCNWKSSVEQGIVRLPSEPEWYLLRETYADAKASQSSVKANVNLECYASSCPVNVFEQGDFCDISGNVWQWTESEIDAFKGFNVHPLYDDFSTPTFDGKHNLIKGGSWISTGNEAINSARYAFRRHFFQHAGFRYVTSKSSEIPRLKVNPFETDADVCQQLESHYGDPVILAQNYQKHLASKVRHYIEFYHCKTQKMLDLGCSVGRTSFELASIFDAIDAVDFSARLIQHGVQLQQDKAVRYQLIAEGELVDYKEVQLNRLDLQTAQHVLFSQGDAANLKAILTGYDLILVQHLIESHYDPTLFFKEVHQKINVGGLLCIVTDFGSDRQKRTETRAFSGVKINGENVTGFDSLTQLLVPHFELLAEDELTQELKVNRRNHIVSQKQLSVWRVK